MSTLDFKARIVSLAFVICYMCVMESSDSPLSAIPANLSVPSRVPEPLSYILFQVLADTAECAVKWHSTFELTSMGMSFRKNHEMYHCKVQSLLYNALVLPIPIMM